MSDSSTALQPRTRTRVRLTATVWREEQVWVAYENGLGGEWQTKRMEQVRLGLLRRWVLRMLT